MKDSNISSVTPGKAVRTVKVTTPNGVEIDAVVVSEICGFSENNSVGDEYITKFYLGYSQNRLFIYYTEYNECEEENLEDIKPKFWKVVCDYCIIPGFDVE